MDHEEKKTIRPVCWVYFLLDATQVQNGQGKQGMERKLRKHAEVYYSSLKEGQTDSKEKCGRREYVTKNHENYGKRAAILGKRLRPGLDAETRSLCSRLSTKHFDREVLRGKRKRRRILEAAQKETETRVRRGEL